MKGGAFAAVVAALVAVAALVLAARIVWRGFDDGIVDRAAPATAAMPSDDQLAAKGAYLAVVGNCIGCHTVRGGEPFAGGRGITTPFGTVYASNLTPDPETGIGKWTSADFWRALHGGRSRDGRLLYPAFPYTSYTRVSREDSDALFAYFKRMVPVRRPNRAHELRFPYDRQWVLAAWRGLFFRPVAYQPDPSRTAEWNRGAYLVRGLGHCDACHEERNLLGATREGAGLAGGLIPMQGWYAPSLASRREAGVADWSVQQVVDLLKTGVSERASVLGPMAEVVYRSTQHLSEVDLRAMAVFLRSLPDRSSPPTPRRKDRVIDSTLSRGGSLYAKHCAECHGERGEGVPGMYAALAGNRTVTMPSAANSIRAVLDGGFPPGTAGNPRPFGMPPFQTLLRDDEIAAIVSFIRDAWGNGAGAVRTWEIDHHRAARTD